VLRGGCNMVGLKSDLDYQLSSFSALTLVIGSSGL